MKHFIKTIVVSVLLFVTAQSSYGFSSENTSALLDPVNKHSVHLENTNHKALVIEQLSLGITDIGSNSREDLLPNSLFLKFLNTGGSKWAVYSSPDLNYLTHSASICPALSGLVLIFPFHLFP